jgi:hypothetical protein
MVKRRLGVGLGLRAGFVLALAGAALSVALPVLAQETGGGILNAAPQPMGRTLPYGLLDKPSQPPAFTVPVEPLGFSAPAPFYLGQENSLASLDFLDESRLLFTFRVPGLLRREAGEEDKRQIRALVLTLPAGTVESEVLWTIHDRARYLWMLKDGHFLLRDRDNLELGDATLELKPSLRFQGPLLFLEMDPSQQFLVADSYEPAAKTKKPDEAPGPASAGTSNAKEPATQSQMVVRILRRDSGKVMLVSRTNAAVHLPINDDGYVERLRGRGDQWLLNLKYFSGGSALLGQVNSITSPGIDFISPQEMLVTTFPATGGRKLVAMGTDGRHLWEYQTSRATARPLLVMAPDGSRLAWEALVLDPSISSASSAFGPEDVKGQLVEVLNAADGKVALSALASPPLDAGGNVAISPSGRRVAVLNGGKILVFELPPAPPLPGNAASMPGR